MSDDLRTRIAAVLDGYVDPSHRYDLADAVIRELGLRRAHATEDRGGSKRKVTRYVTDWKADDD